MSANRPTYMRADECQNVTDLSELVGWWLDRVDESRHDSWWMEGRAALARLTAIARQDPGLLTSLLPKATREREAVSTHSERTA